MNFEGENNDETDFLDNKLELWQSTTSLANDILEAHAMLMKNTNSGDLIMDQTWWSTHRYHHFGNELVKKLGYNKMK